MHDSGQRHALQYFALMACYLSIARNASVMCSYQERLVSSGPSFQDAICIALRI